MQTAVLTVELIFFILATLLMGYLTIKTIVSDIKSRKQQKQLDEALSQFCDKLTTAVVECKETSKTETSKKKSMPDYDNMNIGELKKVAKGLKIKGYYNLHKKELIKAIKETETVSE